MPTNLHRYYGAGYLHFIITSCYQRRALLGTPQNRDLFLEVMFQKSWNGRVGGTVSWWLDTL
jgi:hypothetical protein